MDGSHAITGPPIILAKIMAEGIEVGELPAIQDQS